MLEGVVIRNSVVISKEDISCLGQLSSSLFKIYTFGFCLKNFSKGYSLDSHFLLLLLPFFCKENRYISTWEKFEGETKKIVPQRDLKSFQLISVKD